MSDPDSTTKLKCCSQCKQSFPHTREFFYQHSVRGKKTSHSWCKKCEKKKKVEYRKRYPEKIKSYNKRYREKFKEKLKDISKEYYESNKEIIKKRARQYYIKNFERDKNRRSEYRKKYYIKNKEKYIFIGKKRRLRNKNTSTKDFTKLQWEEMKKIYKNRCAYCGNKTKKLTIDHITPVSKGGDHTYTNIVPACMPCNNKKHAGKPIIPIQPLLII